jgi:Icc-related predicted phosphoesterase
VKLVIISDTHGRHDELGLLQGDVLVHCGDLCLGYDPNDSQLDAIDGWFLKQHFSLILCIGGNHDRPLQRRAKLGPPVLRNAIYLEDQAFAYGGYNFYGTPWVPDLRGWSFYEEENILVEKWARIPSETDILITHTPPYQILDKPRYSGPAGCRHLRERVEVIRPKLHCFGHIHESYGQMEQDGITFVNASITSGQGLNSPITLDLA